jgi:ABC-type phosphate/phosphonate transport system ATPase subunit
MPSPLLSTEKLGLRIEKRTLLKNLSISLNQGTFVAVTGPSGSGKTTLLRTLAGTLKPAEGKVISNLDSTKSLAMIFQDLQLADGATAINNVLGGSLGRHSFLSTLFRFPAEERKEAHHLLSKFKLSGKINQWTSTLSRGERQRVAACRTLLTRPHLLFADEPVSSLDPILAAEVLSHLKSSILSRNGCIVCSLHNDEQVAQFADIVLILDPTEANGWKVEILKQNNK